LLGTASALLKDAAQKGAVVRREATCGIAADNPLTGADGLFLFLRNDPETVQEAPSDAGPGRGPFWARTL
jgi:hypothetical protein